MERKEDRPSQDELRSLFNDYLTGKRSTAPPPKAAPKRPAKPPRPPRPKPVDPLANLSPEAKKRLKGLQGALPPPVYQKLVRRPELAKDPAAFFSQLDRLTPGCGFKGAVAVLLGEQTVEVAAVRRLAALLKVGEREAKALAELPRFAALAPERRAIAARDRVVHQAKRWDCPPELALKVELGVLTEPELAVQLLSRRLRVEADAARRLLPAGEADPIARSAALVKELSQEASGRKIGLTELVRERLETLEAERKLAGTIAEALSIEPELAVRLGGRAAAVPARERAERVIEEVRRKAAELGCGAKDAARLLLGELPDAAIDEIVGKAIAAALGIDPGLGAEIAASPELGELPVGERARKAAKRASALAEDLRVTPAEAAKLLGKAPQAEAAAAALKARLGLGAEAAQALAAWTLAQGQPPAEAVLAAIDKCGELKDSEHCTMDEAALLCAGELTRLDLAAARLVSEFGISRELGLRVAAWMEAEKVGESEAKVRIRNLRGWAAPDMEQACRMLIKEIPTPVKKDSDALPFSGAWE